LTKPLLVRERECKGTKEKVRFFPSPFEERGSRGEINQKMK
jgi:hypothetical protein